MIYPGAGVIDFTDKEVIKFAQTGSIGDLWELRLPPLADYHPSSVPPISLGALPTVLPGQPYGVYWTVLQKWILAEGRPHPQIIASFDILVNTHRTVDVLAFGRLLVQNSLPQNLEAKIQTAFNSYHYPSSGDVDAYTKQILASDPTLNVSMFSIEKIIQLKLTSARIEDTSDIDFLRSRVGEREFSVSKVSESDLDALEAPKPDYHRTELGNPQKSAQQAAETDLSNTPCEGFETNSRAIARMGTLPATRFVWGWHRVDIGCWSFDLYYPQTETRSQDLVLSVYWTIPHGLQFASKAIEQCATISAGASIVTLIVFTDFGVALTEFKALFWQCIKQKFTDAVDCLDAGLTIDTEATGPWH